MISRFFEIFHNSRFRVLTRSNFRYHGLGQCNDIQPYFAGISFYIFLLAICQFRKPLVMNHEATIPYEISFPPGHHSRLLHYNRFSWFRGIFIHAFLIILLHFLLPLEELIVWVCTERLDRLAGLAFNNLSWITFSLLLFPSFSPLQTISCTFSDY